MFPVAAIPMLLEGDLATTAIATAMPRKVVQAADRMVAQAPAGSLQHFTSSGSVFCQLDGSLESSNSSQLGQAL